MIWPKYKISSTCLIHLQKIQYQTKHKIQHQKICIKKPHEKGNRADYTTVSILWWNIFWISLSKSVQICVEHLRITSDRIWEHLIFLECGWCTSAFSAPTSCALLSTHQRCRESRNHLPQLISVSTISTIFGHNLAPKSSTRNNTISKNHALHWPLMLSLVFWTGTTKVMQVVLMTDHKLRIACSYISSTERICVLLTRFAQFQHNFSTISKSPHY